MKYRAFLPALALLLLTACGKAELTGISLQPVTVQAGETAEAAVQYETAGKASDTAIQTAVDANHWTWQTGDESIATVNSQGVVTGLHGGETTLTLTDASGDLTASCTVQVTNPLRELILNDIVLYLDERTEIVLDYDGTENCGAYLCPIEIFACFYKQQLPNLVGKRWYLNIFVREQPAINIRERSQIRVVIL